MIDGTVPCTPIRRFLRVFLLFIRLIKVHFSCARVYYSINYARARGERKMISAISVAVFSSASPFLFHDEY